MMGDRSGSPSRVHTSEDKVHQKDEYWYVRSVLRSKRAGPHKQAWPGVVGRYSMIAEKALLEKGYYTTTILN